jgi:hypothetical protein
MATQLDQMENDFTNINEQLDLMKSTIATKKKLLPDMEKQLKEFEREYRDMAELRQLEKNLGGLKQMMAWAIVKEAEEEALKGLNTQEQLKKREYVQLPFLR